MADSWWSRFINALNPCVHTWEITQTLKDDEQNTQQIRTIKTCMVCGVSKAEDWELPGRNKPCVHRWESQRRISVYGKTERRVNGKPVPDHYEVEQQCMRCGDLRSVRL